MQQTPSPEHLFTTKVLKAQKWPFFSAALLAVESLDWHLSSVDPNELTIGFTTAPIGFANNEAMGFAFEGLELQIISQSIGESNTDPQDNQKNVETFWKRLNKTIEETEAATLIERATKLLKGHGYEYSETEQAWSAPDLPVDEADTSIWEKPTYVTFGLLGINALIYVLMAISGNGIMQQDDDGLIRWGANFTPKILDGEIWRLLSGVFLHANIGHLLGNFYGLLMVGMILEMFLGRVKFLLGYLCCGIVASAFSHYYHGEILSVGASGAIFGGYGMALGIATSNLLTKEERTTLWIYFGIFAGINLVLGFKDGVDNAAHVGGLVMGLLISPVLVWMARYPERKNLQISGLVGMVLLSGVLTGAMVNSMTDYEPEMDKFFGRYKAFEGHYLDYANAPLEDIVQKDSLLYDAAQQMGMAVGYCDSIVATNYFPKNKQTAIRFYREYAHARWRELYCRSNADTKRDSIKIYQALADSLVD